MQAYFFGDGERRLLACFHPAQVTAPGHAQASVLLCGPHGQEGVRAHRLLRVLAERLSREGCDVLRFDPFGSGDSAGDDEELDLLGWQSDLAAAAQELLRRSGGRPQVWLGFRLGATVACCAARDVTAIKPSALVLVEPVAQGSAYLDELALATVKLLEASMSIRSPAWRQSLQRSPQLWRQEAAGFGLGSALQAQLLALTPMSLTVPQGVKLDVVLPLGADETQLQPWLSSESDPSFQVSRPTYEFDWTAEEALNSAIVPHGLLARLVDLCAAQEAHA